MILSTIEVECPACGALPVFPCMTGTGKESSKCHAARGREAARLMAVLVEDAKERARQRAMHTCIKAMSSIRCTACNRGVPYPHATIEEIKGGITQGARK